MLKEGGAAPRQTKPSQRHCAQRLISPGDAPSACSHADAPPASLPLSLQVRKEMQARVPVTPPESAEWLGRMMAEIWAPFVGPLVLKENLGAWQVGGRGRLTCGGGGGRAHLGLKEKPLGKPECVAVEIY